MSQVDSRLPLTAHRRVLFGDGAPVAATVADPTLSAMLAPEAAAFEVFRVLRTKVKALDEQRPLRCLGVVSATRDEGTTAMALGLAAALAQEAARRVLVVEATLREPSLERLLGLRPGPGLGDWLAAADDGTVPLRHLEPWGFTLLTAGMPERAPGERLGSERMSRLLSAARTAFDFVVLDCPPLEPVADSLMLQDVLDGFLLVVRARHSARATIQRAFSHLRSDLVRGVVFNDREEMLSRWLDRRGRRKRV